MGCNGYQAIDLKISIQTLEKYEQWWRYYKSIYSGTISPSSRGVYKSIQSSVERPVDNSS